MGTPSLETIIIALLLTLLAGGSTAIGSLLAFVSKGRNTKFLSGALGLSAGVMVYVSFMDLLPEAMHKLESVYDSKLGMLYVLLSFFGGIGLIALIDWLIPEDENPHEMHTPDEMDPNAGPNHHLKRTGFLLAMAIGIHNFPEGMATFVSALEGLDVAIPIVVAIAIHNIPEGIAVSVPIYYATGNRQKALKYSILSGLAEPIGALVGMAFLLPFWTPLLGAIIIAAVAGVMIYISFDELLPSAERYGHHHVALWGVIAGMVVMAGSLLLF
ncbi:MAG: zinc transporter ZupT [Bacteroidales bacterium]|nr:zinc transporter ZupT [Bacteroidales bacterium]